ncbi:MAG: esterase-like activity of phytase family protein [Erythrobacter sp.]
MLKRAALWGPLLIAALLVGGYVYLHDPFARDGTQLLQVALSEEDPALDRVGVLKYHGGLDIPRMDQNIGGLSGLRWDADSGRLLAITDDARWVWITPVEVSDQLTGIAAIESGNLLGPDGQTLTGKEDGDSESLVYDAETGWAVTFERNHRILSYGESLSGVGIKTLFDAEAELGELESNSGMEAVAVSAKSQLICAERKAQSQRSNCVLHRTETDSYTDFSVHPPSKLEGLGAVPTDADALGDGTFLVLFRSYSPTDGNGAAIVAYSPDGARSEVMTLRPPMTVDNFEGLAVREEATNEGQRRTFIYIVSDDNFSGGQRTLLMKFEIVAND